MKKAMVFALLVGTCLYLSGCKVGIDGNTEPDSTKYDVTIWHRDGTVEEIKEADLATVFNNRWHIVKGKQEYYFTGSDVRVKVH